MKRIDINPKDYPKGSVRRQAAQVLQTEMESKFNGLVDAINSHTQKLVDVESRLHALEGKCSNPTVEIPADVNNKSSLISFAQTMFPDEVVSYFDDLGPFARKLRDALAEKYPLIERINDQEERFEYSAPDEKHSDAFYRVDTDEIIDFMVASKLAGVPLEKLDYSVNQTAPW